MIKKIIPAFFCLMFCSTTMAQTKDTAVYIGGKAVLLSEVVVNSKLDVAAFINRIKNDTTFYKAFKTLDIVGYTSLNDIRMLNKKGETAASLYSKTKQIEQNGCRSSQTISEQSSGDFYTNNHQYNYYTAELYASLFFAKRTICGENNTVGEKDISAEGLSGIEKHKKQLEMLFFNPGKKIDGIPFISNKTAIFDDGMADKYDMSIDIVDHDTTSCYLFSIKVKPAFTNDVVIDEMTTWFDCKTFEVLARNYTLSHDAGVYDFNVQMQVELTHFGQYLVPSLLRYNGDWKVIFKPREHGVFTATLFDFNK
ncbi:MAG TPA: hypothetical protein VK559_04255 [Ferruginibacter sp.]|nr:hypothetical protein [Ferruginibacter sp.]